MIDSIIMLFVIFLQNIIVLLSIFHGLCFTWGVFKFIRFFSINWRLNWKYLNIWSKHRVKYKHKMDATKKPLLIPPEFSTYAEKHGIFQIYEVCTLSCYPFYKSHYDVILPTFSKSIKVPFSLCDIS